MKRTALLRTHPLSVFALVALLLCSACGGSGTSSGAAAATASIYPAAFRAAGWSGSATVTFPSSCTLKMVSTGAPPYHAAYYLGPVSAQYPTQVATTPVGGLKLAIVPYLPGSLVANTESINMCPVKAATTTPTQGGAIGYMLTGEVLFNAYEAGNVDPALADNVTLSFVDANGVTQTASFIDACNSHATPPAMTYTWHYHGVPTCLAAQVDGSSGPSHLIGIAFDGFPIYGGRDINGNIVPVSQLDACNGITSPTPEFPQGAYHYVLPIGVTNGQSSMNCFSGTETSGLMVDGRKMACPMPPDKMRTMLAHMQQNAARPVKPQVTSASGM